MSGPTYVRITADVTDLTAKLAIAKAEFANANADLRGMAQQMTQAGAVASSELKAGLASAAEATAAARAEVAGFNIQLKEVGAAGGGLASMRAGIDETLAPLKTMQATMAALGPALMVAFAGREIVGAIEHTAELGANLAKLSEQTGVAVETLSGWHYGADQVDVSAESLDTSVKRLGRSIQEALKTPTSNAAESFHALGISQDFLKENSNNLQAVLMKMADGFHSHADGANADAAAMATLGRGGVEMLPWLRQGSQAIQEQNDRQKELGAQMTGPMSEVMKQHVQAVKDLGQVWDGVWISLTNHVIPTLTDLGIWFSKNKSQIAEYTSDLTKLGLVAAGVSPALWAQAPGGAAPGKKSGGAAPSTPKPELPNAGDPKDFYSTSKDQLDQQLLQQQLFGEKAKAYELQFWQSKLTIARAGGTDYVAAAREITSNVYQLESEIHGRGTKELKDYYAQWKEQLNQQLIQQQLFGQQAKAYELQFWQGKLTIAQAGGKDYVSASREISSNVYQLENEAHTAQESADKKALDDKKRSLDEGYRAFKATIDAEKEAAAGNIAEQLILDQHLMDRAKGLYTQDSANFQSALKTKTADMKAEIDKQMEPYKQAATSIGNSFNQMFNGILTGSKRFAQSMQQMTLSLAEGFAKMGIKMVEDWALNQIRNTLNTQQQQLQQTAAVATGAAAQTAIKAAAAGEGKAVDAMAGSASIFADANKAAAGAYAAVAGIPIIGPELAPIAAVTAYGAVLAFDVLSAAGGMDVAAGVNPITQLHEKEMVLPAHLSERVRSMTDDGGASGGRTLHLHGPFVQAIDTQTGMEFLMNNIPKFAKEIAKYQDMNPSSRPKY